MKKAIQDVIDFHKAMKLPIGKKIKFPDKELVKLRKRLVTEESQELKRAIRKRDMVRVADGITDLIYVLIEMAVTFGIPLEAVWDEVHRTNMLKKRRACSGRWQAAKA